MNPNLQVQVKLTIETKELLIFTVAVNLLKDFLEIINLCKTNTNLLPFMVKRTNYLLLLVNMNIN